MLVMFMHIYVCIVEAEWGAGSKLHLCIKYGEGIALRSLFLFYLWFHFRYGFAYLQPSQ